MSAGHDDIYELTDRGRDELAAGATTLTAQELELLVLVDGKRAASAIAALAKGSDPSKVSGALHKLAAGGFIRFAAPKPNEGFDYFFAAGHADPSEQTIMRAEREAEGGASSLREQGYYVSIARRAKQPQAPRKLTVLVVEDEPLVAKYLVALVKSEGHEVRLAANREQIVAELRKAPLPDLVFLDVMLPDANGFDVLQRMKRHPAIAEVPVVIVTTQATRESVMKGLALGADGYFTKPFEVDVLLRGMKAVLGQLSPEGEAARPKRDPWLGR
jgi:CheY-like chemotaxis protein